MLIAISKSYPVGVDVECCEREVDTDRIMNRFFSAEESSAVKNSSEFFHCWTRKEAFIKAVGEGLRCPLTSFTVSCNSSEQNFLISLPDKYGKIGQYSTYTFVPDRNYVAAVVACGSIESWSFFDLQQLPDC